MTLVDRPFSAGPPKWGPALPPVRPSVGGSPTGLLHAATAVLFPWASASAEAFFVSVGTVTLQHTEGNISEPRINDRIHANEVRLVGPAGEQVGIVRLEDALRLAREADLDLVEVAPMARPPVAKLMDYGKFKYEAAQKARESRRNQTNTVIKEMKLRPKIDSHDYETKKGHVVRFLKAGDKVKITIMFRGREQSRPELGFNLLKKLADDVVEDGFVESAPKQDGRNMLMVLSPTKKKSEARVDAEANKQARMAQRAADAEAERNAEAEHRAAHQGGVSLKKRRGPADNMDPDIDL